MHHSPTSSHTTFDAAGTRCLQTEGLTQMYVVPTITVNFFKSTSDDDPY